MVIPQTGSSTSAGCDSGVIVRMRVTFSWASSALTQPLASALHSGLVHATFPAWTPETPHRAARYLTNWPGFASNLVLQPFEQK